MNSVRDPSAPTLGDIFIAIVGEDGSQSDAGGTLGSDWGCFGGALG